MAMTYFVNLEGETLAVQIEEDGSIYKVIVGENTFQLDWEELRHGCSVKNQWGKHCFYFVSANQKENQYLVEVDGHILSIRVEDRLHHQARVKKGKPVEQEQLQVRSPLPGKIKALLVSPGDRVKAGAPLCIMEAMKMENPLMAEYPGKVVKVWVTEGQTVEAGEILCEVIHTIE